MSRAGVEHAESLNHPISLNLGLRRACVEGMLRRDIEAVTEFADRLAALRAAYETYKGSWEGIFFQDWAQLCTRPDPVLFDRMQLFLRHLDATKNWALLPCFMTSAAELCGRFGDATIAAALLERAAELVNMTGARWWEAEITRLQARIGARDREQVTALLEASLASARQQGAKLWELRTAMSLAELWREQGNYAAARDVLAPVCGWFREGKNTADFMAARRLLDQIGSPRT